MTTTISPGRQQIAGGDSDPQVRDLATQRGHWHMQQMTVGQYLERQDIFERESQQVSFENGATFNWKASVQRAVIDIKKSPIKKRMLRDLLRGGTLPPIVVYDDHRDDKRLDVVDGLQRTHVLSEALSALIAVENGRAPAPYAQTQIEQIQADEQTLLAVADFLQRPLTLQVWEDLAPSELIRLFMVLNVGQQKVSARHLLEVVDAPLRATFEEWGIPVLSEKEEKELPRARRRKEGAPEPPPSPKATHWSFEHLLAGLTAYVSRNPHTKTNDLVKDDQALRDDLGERITDLGSEACQADFQWACQELHSLIQECYAAQPDEHRRSWGSALRSETFFVPMMAALGKARDRSKGLTVEHHKQELLEQLRDAPSPDPLHFTNGDDGLERLQEEIRSNIGRRRRGIVYYSWLQYFTQGPQSESDYPIDWTTGDIFRE